MADVRPDHPMFDRVGAARGPGVHTDEASAALPDLLGALTARDAATLQAGAASATARSNPRGAPALHDDRDVIVPQRALFPIARLVTGMWGADETKGQVFDATFSRTVGRPSLPVARDKPSDARLDVPFFDRMEQCLEEVRRVRRKALKRYVALGVPRANRGWPKHLDHMIKALQFVLDQRTSARPSIVAPNRLVFGLPFTSAGWPPLSEGNTKLSFVAYSELPMATCPGAGACGVPFNKYAKQEENLRACKERNAERRALAKRTGTKAAKFEDCGETVGGWCYSFKAFAYPAAFCRLFLNTLANYFDRECAIIAGGGRNLAPTAYRERVLAAIRGHAEARLWPNLVKHLAMQMTADARGVPRAPGRRKKAGAPSAPRTVFLRLFVDGDINHEDNILAWMEAVGQMGKDSPLLDGGGHVEVYGYSKSWQQFDNVNRYTGGTWPANYTINLSSGSVYAKGAAYAPLRASVENLPITRGYFEAIHINEYMPKLHAQAKLMQQNAPGGVVPMPPPRDTPFAFDAERIRVFLLLNTVRTRDDVERLFPDVRWPAGKGALTEEEIHKIAYTHYLTRLVAQPAFGATVRRELERDDKNASEADYLALYEARQKDILRQALSGGATLVEDYSTKKLHDKALALVLHETLWVHGLGGSCPLICGNCSDDPADATRGGGEATGVHRCASRGAFWKQKISIGLH